jgi:hypothetical protein
MSRILTARSGKIVLGGGKHIFIACMPKSASTYLSAIIAELPGMNEVVLTFGHRLRPGGIRRGLCLCAASE